MVRIPRLHLPPFQCRGPTGPTPFSRRFGPGSPFENNREFWVGGLDRTTRVPSLR